MGGERISRDEVLHVARLARIAIDETAADELRAELTRILEAFADLSTLELSSAGGPPLTGQTLLRDDEADSPVEDEPLARIAPRLGRRHVLVPRVIR